MTPALPPCWRSEVIQTLPLRMSGDMNVASVGQRGRSRTQSRVVGLPWQRLDFGAASYLSFQGSSQRGGDKLRRRRPWKVALGTRCVSVNLITTWTWTWTLTLTLTLRVELDQSAASSISRVDAAACLVGPTPTAVEEEPRPWRLLLWLSSAHLKRS